MAFICLNGEFLSDQAQYVTANNSAMSYGLVYSEEMFASGTTVLFFAEHIANCIKALNILQIEVPVKLLNTPGILHKEITKLLTKNRYFLGAIVKMIIFLDNNSKTNYLITSEKEENPKYYLNTQGFRIDVFEEFRKEKTEISDLYKFQPYQFYKAQNFVKANNLNDCIILDNENQVVESLSGFIFLVKDDKLYASPLEVGCVTNIMASVIIQLFENLNIPFSNQTSFTVDHLMEADEIFLTNHVGIRWVLAFRNRRYYNKYSKTLVAKLNDCKSG